MRREPWQKSAVGRKLGIDDVMAEVLPDQKATMVKKLQTDGRFGAMAGDGINDAPALAQAQVGIAMGTGAEVAMESTAVTLIKGDLQGIVLATCTLSRLDGLQPKRKVSALSNPLPWGWARYRAR